VLDAVLRAPAATATVVREAAFKGSGLPSPLQEYVGKLRSESYRLTEKDLHRLIAEGYSEDMVFEITIAGALGAAEERMQAALRALKGD
jgi:hypothetical protein